MSLTKYLPKIYDDTVEMHAIMLSEDTEFKTLKNNVRNAFNNNFVVTTNETGIKNYEDILNIDADLTTEDLKFRQERVLNRLVSHIPFTEKYLQQKLDIMIGKNTNADYTPDNPDNSNWYYLIDYNNYTLDIYITQPGKSWLKEVEYFCQTVIPCNIQWELHPFKAKWQAVKENFDTWQDVKDDNSTWQDVLDGGWLS